jgi:hypothetical protein
MEFYENKGTQSGRDVEGVTRSDSKLFPESVPKLDDRALKKAPGVKSYANIINYIHIHF